MNLEKTKRFFEYLPDTLKKALGWLILTYLIPFFNIVIIWAIQGKDFSVNLNITNIILVTNAVFIVSLLHFFYNSKKREFTYITNIVTVVLAIVLFALSVAQIEKQITILPLSIYKYGAYITLIISILLGIISKYDEVEAISQSRANDGKKVNSTKIGDKIIKV